MSYTPPARRLGGLSVEMAERYGKPHIGAFYAGDSVRSNVLEEGAVCACCGRPATNSHHCPPLSRGRYFSLRLPSGTWCLRPSLIAVCGSGTTGCHNGFHGGARFTADWVWESDAAAYRWWDGTLLADFGPHSPTLYRFGHWEIKDRLTGNVIEVRS